MSAPSDGAVRYQSSEEVHDVVVSRGRWRGAGGALGAEPLQDLRGARRPRPRPAVAHLGLQLLQALLNAGADAQTRMT